MGPERRILANTAFLSSGKALGDLCSFFFLVSFARFFGADVLGEYAFAMSVGGLASVCIDCGLTTVLVREVSREPRRNAELGGTILAAQAVLAALVWAGIAFWAWLSDYAHDLKLIVVLIGGYHVLYELSLVFRAQFRAHEETQYSAFLEVFHRILILAGGSACMAIWKASDLPTF